MGPFVPRVGADYLAASGLPVRVIVVNEDQIELQSLVTDSRLWVPANYPLESSLGGEPIVARRPQPHLWNECQPIVSQRTPKPLAPLIDSLLLSGGNTMRGIIREVKRRASAACRDKDVAANVRARLYWLRKRSYKIERDSQGHLKACVPQIN